MPNYQTHDKIAYIAVIPISAIMQYTLSLSLQDTFIFAGGFIISNYWLSPDLDTNSIMIQRWSFLYWLWIPYRNVIKHRSLVSHSGPLSALIRISYIGVPLILIGLLVNIPLFSIALESHIFLLFLLSAVLSDTLHTITDILWSAIR